MQPFSSVCFPDAFALALFRYRSRMPRLGISISRVLPSLRVDWRVCEGRFGACSVKIERFDASVKAFREGGVARRALLRRRCPGHRRRVVVVACVVVVVARVLLLGPYRYYYYYYFSPRRSCCCCCFCSNSRRFLALLNCSCCQNSSPIVCHPLSPGVSAFLSPFSTLCETTAYTHPNLSLRSCGLTSSARPALRNTWKPTSLHFQPSHHSSLSACRRQIWAVSNSPRINVARRTHLRLIVLACVSFSYRPLRFRWRRRRRKSSTESLRRARRAECRCNLSVPSIEGN